jgi:hypothetical protein
MDLTFLARHPQYVQLLGVGVVWISLHCAGMCGPIVLGLDLGETASENPSLSPRRKMARSFAHITAYQLGRSVTYAAIGALVGLGGAALQIKFRQFSEATGLFIAVALISFGIIRLTNLKTFGQFFAGPDIGKPIARAAKWARSFSGIQQKFLLGIVLGFLPCMITFWALGLAASTQSPLHGAVIMVVLVWMTSIVIYSFAVLPALLPKKLMPLRDKLLTVFLILSGVWLGFVSMAANQWINHQSVSFTLSGQGFTIMFW